MGKVLDIKTGKELDGPVPQPQPPEAEQRGSYWYCTNCNREDAKLFKLDCAGGVWCGDCGIRIKNLSTKGVKDAA